MPAKRVPMSVTKELVKATDNRWYVEVGCFSAEHHQWLLLTPDDALEVATDLLAMRQEYDRKRK